MEAGRKRDDENDDCEKKKRNLLRSSSSASESTRRPPCLVGLTPRLDPREWLLHAEEGRAQCVQLRRVPAPGVVAVRNHREHGKVRDGVRIQVEDRRLVIVRVSDLFTTVHYTVHHPTPPRPILDSKLTSLKGNQKFMAIVVRGAM